MSKYLYIYDLTLKWSTKISDLDIINHLKQIAKKWGFQQEKGEDKGYRHWQIRLSLIKKTTEHRLRAMIKNTPLQSAHVSITSNGCNDVYYYVTKTDTRVDGTKPYTDKDPPPPPLTKQLKIFMQEPLAPWMRTLYNEMIKFDMRHINIIYDPKGGKRKTLFVEYCQYKGIATQIPLYRSYEDVTSFVCSYKAQGNNTDCFMIDMPRGIRKDRLDEFYSGIESLKDGFLADKRHKATIIRIDRPGIFIFTNQIPTQIQELSMDRWVIWLITDEQDDEPLVLRNITDNVLKTDPEPNPASLIEWSNDELQLLSTSD